MVVEVTRGVLASLREEAARAVPHECCGVLLGRGEMIDAVRPAANIADQPETRFEIDPAVLLAVHKAEREGGPRVLGYYHSHPAGHPIPSATDCEHASGDGRIWAIVANDEVGFWRDCGEGFSPVEVTVL
jgi:proteasome lid subunit RPN8/RPN11